MKYKVYFTPKANKHLGRLHPNDREKIVTKANKLSLNPTPQGKKVKKMKTFKNLFRLRIGNVRILYDINHKQKEILVRDVGYRGQIY